MFYEYEVSSCKIAKNVNLCRNIMPLKYQIIQVIAVMIAPAHIACVKNQYIDFNQCKVINASVSFSLLLIKP